MANEIFHRVQTGFCFRLI